MMLLGQDKKEVDNMTEQWIWYERVSAMGIGYDTYISADGNTARNVWDDGYIEEYERA